jgi:glycine betaine/choline ABC-type transport system substrate-binding protein/lipoprotein-anchoring transpeptidase ErfK/SrfK
MRFGLFAAVAAAALGAAAPAEAARVVIADKGFTESAIVAQAYGLALEAQGHEVVYRRASTSAVAHAAITAGAIDLFPEYTGTTHLTILNRPQQHDFPAVLAGIREAFLPLGLVATEPAPFSDANRVACTRQTATRLRLTTLSSLRRHPRQITYAASREHLLRPDGLVVLAREYGALFKGLAIQPIDRRYAAIRAGRADCVHAFSTDPEPPRLGLKVLRDDRGSFTGTPYRGYVVLRKAAADATPGLQATIDQVSALLTTSRVRALNEAVVIRRRGTRRTAAEFLRDHGVVSPAFAAGIKAVAPEALPDAVVAGVPPVGATDRRVRLFFIRGEQMESRARTLPTGLAPEATVREAIRRLLQGPTPGERSKLDIRTTIPSGTTLLDLKVRDGIATVNLSPAFARGNDMTEIAARANQVVRTADQFTFVTSVRLLVGSQGGDATWTEDSGAAPTTVVTTGSGGSTVPGNVRDVQQRLIELRYLPTGTDHGRNDYRTQQAVMAFQSWQGLKRDGLAGPDTLTALTDADVPAATSLRGRRIEVHRARAVVLLIDGGRVVRAIHTSTGKRGFETPIGVYHVYRKAERDWSYPFQVWLPWASYFTGGYALHQGDVPPTPASHGSVRIPSSEAKVVYDFAKMGTTVAVY